MTNYTRNRYTEVCLTPTRRLASIRKEFRREGAKSPPALWKMGEIGERAVAYSITRRILGKSDDTCYLGKYARYRYDEYYAWTTKMLVESKLMTEKVEKDIQIAGIDVILLPHKVIKEGKFISKEYVFDHLFDCIQVKFQPYASNWGTINVETHTDFKCPYSNMSGDYFKVDRPSVKPTGINKTAAFWTAYIVNASSIILAPTSTYQELTYGKDIYYTGTTYKPYKSNDWRCSAGTRINILALLRAEATEVIHTDPVFNEYLQQIHTTKFGSITNPDNWKLFVQSWPIETLVTALERGVKALEPNQLRGTTDE